MTNSKNISDPCVLFRGLAEETWERIGFARRRRGLKIFETTITQNLLYSITKILGPGGLVTAEEAIDEAANGNDIELIVRDKNGHDHFFAVQAKIIYKNGRYGALSGKKNQCVSLINYARKMGGSPIYLFYNFGGLSANLTFENRFFSPLSQKQIGLYGCSFAHAYNVLGLMSARGAPRLTHINYNYALPWHHLVCNGVFYRDGISKGKKGREVGKKWRTIKISDFVGEELDYISLGNELDDFEPSVEKEDSKKKLYSLKDDISLTDIRVPKGSRDVREIDVGKYPVEKIYPGLEKFFSPRFRITVDNFLR